MVHFLSMLNTLILVTCFVLVNKVHLIYLAFSFTACRWRIPVTICYQIVPFHTSDQIKDWFQQTTALNQSLLSTTLLAIMGYEPNSLIASHFYTILIWFTDQLTRNSMRMGFSCSLPCILLNVHSILARLLTSKRFNLQVRSKCVLHETFMLKTQTTT